MQARIEEVLRFERFYSRRLRDAAKAARVQECTAAEIQIFRELATGPCTNVYLSWRLDLDPGYVSRALKVLELSGQITVSTCRRDRRQGEIGLTDWGHQIVRSLQEFDENRVHEILDGLPERQQERLVGAMGVIIEIFERDPLANFLECIRET